MRPGDPADLIRLHDLVSFKVMETWIDGECVARYGRSLLPKSKSPRANQVRASPKQASDFAVPVAAPLHSGKIRIIEALDGQIITGAAEAEARVQDGLITTDPARDVLKITVVNRYADAPPAVAFVRGVGLKSGAIASSVAHDCHNIVAVGTSDEGLASVVNLVIENEGGIAVVGQGGVTDVLPLPVAGLMSDGHAEDVAAGYARLTKAAEALGSPLHAPYMTLSFLALLVIPALKLSDLGLFDGTKFEFVPVAS
jgi:adenine deaminase